MKCREKRAVQLWMLSMALWCSPYADALGLGDIQVSSKLGEPFKAQIDLIELTAADAQDIKARLASTDEYKKIGLQPPDGIKFRFKLFNEPGAQPLLRITTLRPIEDLFVNLLIEIVSPSGKFTKSYTFLLDPPTLDSSNQFEVPAENVQPTAQADPSQSGGASLPSGASDSKPASVSSVGKTAIRRKNRGHVATSVVGRAIGMPIQHEGGYGEESRDYKPFGKLSLTLSTSLSISKSDPGTPGSLRESGDALQEELIAKEKTLNELNMQIAEMQAVIKTLQDRLGIPANLPASGVAGSGVAVQSAEVGVVAEAGDATSKPEQIVPVVQQSGWSLKEAVKPLMANWRMPALALIVLLLTIFGIVLYRKRKDEQKQGLFDDLGEVPVLPTIKEATPVEVMPVGISSIKIPAYVQNNDELVSPAVSSVVPSFDQTRNTEIDSMIEEAELFAIHGHQYKAIEILNDIILKYPAEVDAWLLLLSIYRNKKSAAQFESVARRFLGNNGSDGAWKTVQEAGRSIEPDNELYFDPDSAITENLNQIIMPKRRLLGDFLIEMNAISAEDLESCLAHFDSLRDGRLGDFLVSLGLIEQRQLEEALLQQGKKASNEQAAYPKHEVNSPENALKPRSISDVLIEMGVLTEQDLEQILANFDPKLHGHCGSYLVSCGAITKEQLHAALLLQLSGASPSQLHPEDEHFISWHGRKV